jgi:hypothetical protein
MRAFVSPSRFSGLNLWVELSRGGIALPGSEQLLAGALTLAVRRRSHRKGGIAGGFS